MSRLFVDPLRAADPLALPALERELTLEWLVWDAYVAGKRRVDVHPLFLDRAAHEDAIAIAERAWKLVAHDRDDEERARYRLHPDVERLAAAARSAGDLGSIARVDLLLRDDDRFVACEVNADCPGGHNETLALPRLARAAGLRRGIDPTHVAPRLVERLLEIAGGLPIALVYATAWAEDLQVCALLERLITERGGRAVRCSPTQLTRHASGRVAYRGEPIGALYRFYPLEYMEEQSNLDAIVHATERGLLKSMSSFACIHAQSKLAMARAEPNDVFPETIAFADMPRERLLAERDEWVLKRDLSRVGDHVFLGSLAEDAEWKVLCEEIAEAEREGDVWIAQRFVPQKTITTPWGPRWATLGVYLIDGVFAGYFARLAETVHCSHEALVLPVFVGAA